LENFDIFLGKGVDLCLVRRYHTHVESK
jgi:hypothetical protein